MLLTCFLAGGAIELLNAILRARAVHALNGSSRKAGMVLTFGGLALRVGWTALVLMWAFRQGVLHGGAALLGYWFSRWLIIIWVNSHYPASGR